MSHSDDNKNDDDDDDEHNNHIGEVSVNHINSEQVAVDKSEDIAVAGILLDQHKAVVGTPETVDGGTLTRTTTKYYHVC